jgi:hypothetical protein
LAAEDKHMDSFQWSTHIPFIIIILMSHSVFLYRADINKILAPLTEVDFLATVEQIRHPGFLL